MKKIIILLVTFLYCLVPQAQEEQARGEIFIWFENPPATWSLEFTVSTEYAYWDADKYDPNHYISEDYEGDTKTFTTYTDYTGIDLCYDDNEADFIIGLGLYKIEIEYDNETSYFYVDFRTSDIPECTGGYSVDVSYDYNIQLKQFRLRESETIINGTTQKVWDYHEVCEQETEDFELYLTVSNQNNNPYLEWNEYNDENIDGYNVYRKITTSSGTTTEVEFTTNTYYLDEDFYIDPPKTPGDDEVEYWIKAKISSTEESLEGNHV